MKLIKRFTAKSLSVALAPVREEQKDKKRHAHDGFCATNGVAIDGMSNGRRVGEPKRAYLGDCLLH